MEALKNVKFILLGGEYLNLKTAENIVNLTNAELFSVYGPTETTVVSNIKKINSIILNKNNNKDIIITVGRPLCNFKIFILDKYMKPVPIGIPGEIYISGLGVGIGYLNRKELTNEKFIDCPFIHGKENNGKAMKMYKSGDLGKWTEDGELICLGREDFQIKIRGQRVELSEIENTINELNGIDYCIVLDKINNKDDKYLIAYYISKSNVDGKEIREFLKKKLPLYMIPSYFIKIDKLPLSFTGKLNRSLLSEPNINEIMEGEYVEPETKIEKEICKIYSNIFNMNENIIDILSKSIICDLAKYIEKLIENNENNNKVEIIEKRFLNEFPITSQQLGVYIDSIKNPNSIIYNIPISINLKTDIDIGKLKDSFIKIFNSHQILKSKYIEKEIDGKFEIYGVIDDERILKFEKYSHNNSNNFIRPFDLCNDTLIRVGFIEENDEKILLVDMHHIISDGVSISIIAKELNNYYYNNENIDENNSSKIEFSDYAYYINEQKKSENYDKQFSFYKEMFSTDYEILDIPKINNYKFNDDIDDLSKDSEIKNINEITKYISNENCEKINKYIKSQKVSKNVFFMTIYGYVLSKYSNQDKIYTSIINANRNNYYTENMIGMFVSTQPIILKFDNDEYSFDELLKENMDYLLNVYNNQDISFSELKNKLNLKNINNTFIYQPKSLIDSSSNNNNSIFSNKALDNQFFSLYEKNNTKFDITFSIIENENGYLISVNYNKNIYDEYLINKIINSYIEVINNIEHFDQNIKEIQYIPSEERNKILYKFNDNQFKYEQNKLYHVEFSEVAKANGNKCAIVCNDIKFSYKEIDEMSNSLAHLLRSKNIQRNDIIPIISERSQYYVIGTLGIMKSGGAFLPIDPDFPEERINYILSEVKAKIILYFITNDENKNKIKYNINENIEKYDLDLHNYSENRNEIENINECNDICYIIFTSGTTGTPKGVIISHNNLINYSLYGNTTINGKKEIYKIEFKNVLAISKYTFDMSMIEIYFPLLNSYTVVMCNDLQYNNPSLIGELIVTNNVEYIVSTPSRINNYLSDKTFRNSIKNIKILSIGGEKYNTEILFKIKKLSKCLIYAIYGPTETTVICSLLKFKLENLINEEDFIITIGKPLCNSSIYILDKNLNPVPIGVTGEIYISGLGVSKGYLNRKDLTDKSFINCPFISDNGKQMKMYKSGDLGRWTEDGEIECLGRIDFQVKIHGQRIELEEIENTIREINGIDYCVVLDKINNNKNNDKYLIAYYISKTHITSKLIREFLKKKLPLYMIPNYFIKIDNIPFNNNGKLDRNALPEPNIDEIIKEEYVEPETQIEKEICKIYSNIFNMKENIVGKYSDFFELGGDSFNAIRVISNIEKTFNIKLNIKNILSNSLVCELANYIEKLIENNENNNKVEI
eukprot:jgi/Orpsp1_1/1189002/evm.model.d7180000068750.1